MASQKPAAETTPKNLGEVTNEIYTMLSDLGSEDEQARVLASVNALLGTSVAVGNHAAQTSSVGAIANTATPATTASSAAEYFTAKEPANKGELLAVAARFREETEGAEAHSKEELAAVFQSARRNFDGHHFNRDIKNAQNQAGFFNKGGERGQYTLSYSGQQFVDALPDRDAAQKHRKKSSTRKKTSKGGKKTAKKSG